MSRFLMDRAVFDNPIWQDIPCFRLFFLLVGKAAFKDGIKAGRIDLKRGQYLRSIRNLQKDLIYFDRNTEIEYSTATIKRRIDLLRQDGRIETQELECGTLFTILNYEEYQCFSGVSNEGIETGSKQDRNRIETIRTKAINANKKPPVSPPVGDKQKRAVRLDEDWEPDQKLLSWAEENHPAVDPKWQTTLFKNHFIGNGKRMVSWDRTWQNWIARALDFSRPNPRVTPNLVHKSRNQKILEAWKSGKTFIHKPSGNKVHSNSLEPFSERSQIVTEKDPDSFRSKTTNNRAFFREFEVME